MNRSSRALATWGLGAILTLACGSLLAKPQISGGPDAVRIDAQNASIDEIMAALAESFGLNYKSSAKLDKQMSGTYEGSLRRVVARLLEGHNFVVKTNKGKLEITVLAPGRNVPRTAVASASPPAPAAKGAALAAKPSPVPATLPVAGATPPAASDAPVPTPSLLAPPIKLAEGPAIAPPVPTPQSIQAIKPPEVLPSTMAPPMPSTSGPLLVPEVKVSINPSSIPALMPVPAADGPAARQ